MKYVLTTCVLLLLVGCAKGARGPGLGFDAATGLDGGAMDAMVLPDARVTMDTGRPDDSAIVIEDAATTPDAGRPIDAVTSPDSGGGGDPLSPFLSLPDPSGQVCTTPGSFGECPSIQVCRFFDSEDGRCETCEPCGNLNAACTDSSECDILFMCFTGRCTNFCQLGTFGCGPIEDCIDIGHPTHGVCRPF